MPLIARLSCFEMARNSYESYKLLTGVVGLMMVVVVVGGGFSILGGCRVVMKRVNVLM